MIEMEKNTKSSFRKLLIIGSVLFVIGFIFWKALVDFYVLLIKYDYKGFTTTGAWYYPRIKTAFVLGIIPVIIVASWRICKISLYKHKIISGLIMLTSMIVTGILRVRYLKPPEDIEQQFIPDFSTLDYISTSEMKIWLFLLLGLATGFLINVFGFIVVKHEHKK